MTAQLSRPASVLPAQAHMPPVAPPHLRLRTLVVGAGEAGQALARDLGAAPEFGLEPVGFLDDDLAKRVDGELPLLGTLDQVAEVARAQRAEAVVVAIPLLDPEAFRRVTKGAAAAGATVRYLPSFVAALERRVVGSDMRWLELGQLIGRDEVHVVSTAAADAIRGRSVLVTGAGGSIGSELCRQVFGFGPSRLVTLDHDESNLHRLRLELWGNGLEDDEDCVVADIRDRDRLDQLFGEIRPDLVFHAAAHKHLPMLEKHPCEAVKSNVAGTENVLWAAMSHGAERFILISTDKAADPTSVLGATKRLAELLVQHEAGGPTKAAVVRFGNVLGSRGSLLSIFAEQLSQGLPLTITHPDMTRFFMTIEEAAGLVVEASRLADMGEIFVLDMGEPVRVMDVAQSFASLLHRPDARIEFTGVRDGEKLTERLFSERESAQPTAHPRIFRVHGREEIHQLHQKLSTLYQDAHHNDADAVRRRLQDLLPDYKPRIPATHARPAPYPDDY